jgi:hypothetical protein
MKKIILSFIAIFLIFSVCKTAFATKYTSIYYKGEYSTLNIGNKQVPIKNYAVIQLFFKNNKVPKIKMGFVVGKNFLLPLAWCYSQNNTPIQIIFKGKELNGFKHSFSLVGPLLPMLSRGVMYNIKMIGYCNDKAEIKFYIHYSSQKMIEVREKLLFFPYKTYDVFLSTKNIFAEIFNKNGKVIGIATPPIKINK